MSRKVKKLSLNVEVLRQLTDDEGSRVNGGEYSVDYCESGYSCACPSAMATCNCPTWAYGCTQGVGCTAG